MTTATTKATPPKAPAQPFGKAAPEVKPPVDAKPPVETTEVKLEKQTETAPEVKPDASAPQEDDVTLEDILADIEPFNEQERVPSNWQLEDSETEGCVMCINLRSGRKLDIPMELFNILLRG